VASRQRLETQSLRRLISTNPTKVPHCLRTSCKRRALSRKTQLRYSGFMSPLSSPAQSYPQRTPASLPQDIKPPSRPQPREHGAIQTARAAARTDHRRTRACQCRGYLDSRASRNAGGSGQGSARVAPHSDWPVASDRSQAQRNKAIANSAYCALLLAPIAASLTPRALRASRPPRFHRLDQRIAGGRATGST